MAKRIILWGACRLGLPGIMQGPRSAVLGPGQSRKPIRIQSLHYLRSVAFDTAVVIWTLVLSPAIPVLRVFDASSAKVRAVSQLWSRGVVFLLKYVVGLDYGEQGRENI